MWAFLERLLDSWTEPDLFWLRATFDAIIAAAYFLIPAALSSFVSTRRDIDFGWVFWVFAFFMTACGFTHLGVMPSVGWKFDRWLDVVMMQRALGQGDQTAPRGTPGVPGAST